MRPRAPRKSRTSSQRAHPEDPRVGAAIDVAWEFISGGPRNRRQRNASLEAHRAARDATTEVARLAARAAGDAASAAYLHPIAKAHRVGHILRAAACVARIAELNSDDDPAAGARAIGDATARATPVLRGARPVPGPSGRQEPHRPAHVRLGLVAAGAPLDDPLRDEQDPSPQGRSVRR